MFIPITAEKKSTPPVDITVVNDCHYPLKISSKADAKLYVVVSPHEKIFLVGGQDDNGLNLDKYCFQLLGKNIPSNCSLIFDKSKRIAEVTIPFVRWRRDSI